MTTPYTDRFRNPADARNFSNPERQLWATVLQAMIEDAVHGAPSILGNRKTRQRLTAEACAYFRDPTPSLSVICELLDLDPAAVRQRVVRQIETAEHGATPNQQGRKQFRRYARSRNQPEQWA
ncbi:hypothetical protein [Pseudoponticoccus marisrubri]|uniref:Uncharacterized protein n=1 Tax=Pseudoponticoccus marisrubri TaxID=1685382 RepID=A0A0W7WPH9_9RHOB|nr:hypothetical protein [Pseudoponticoccus marisrubri]KUF12408.1 hypothetical protein AVJ23_01370 [Pseudoponticoccus marisrubri]